MISLSGWHSIRRIRQTIEFDGAFDESGETILALVAAEENSTSVA
ncbi:MAG: hypothetical protein WCK86_23840 [Planctomycetia bacterium]